MGLQVGQVCYADHDAAWAAIVSEYPIQSGGVLLSNPANRVDTTSGFQLSVDVSDPAISPGTVATKSYALNLPPCTTDTVPMAGWSIPTLLLIVAVLVVASLGYIAGRQR